MPLRTAGNQPETLPSLSHPEAVNEQLERAVLHYQALYGRLRATTLARLLALWRVFGGVSDDDADRFVAAAVPLIEGAQRASGALVSAYIATLLRLAGYDHRPLHAPPLSIAALRGVDAAEVYRRPIIALRTALGEGKLFDFAMYVAGQRLEQIGSTDIAMAQRQATLTVIDGEPRIVGYRRVLTGSSCAFCATASTQRYRKKTLMPLHARCDCGVAPIFGVEDPGQVINQRLVDDLKAAAKTSGSPDFWRNRHVTVDEDGTVHLPQVAVRQHGEMGPVLTNATHRFTNEAQVA